MISFQLPDAAEIQQQDLQARFGYEMRLAHERQIKRLQMGVGDVIEVVFELDPIHRPPLGGVTPRTQRVVVEFTQNLDTTMDMVFTAMRALSDPQSELGHAHEAIRKLVSVRIAPREQVFDFTGDGRKG